MHVLILGGTRDAMNLAEQLVDHPSLRPTYSLAGRTRRPLPPALHTRRGGFGGVEGLGRWLAENQVAAVVDATHPFAAQMSHHAVAACRELGIPLASLTRAPWSEQPGDRWIRVPDLAGAAEAVRRETQTGATVLLTTGRTSLDPFEAIPGRHFVVRCVDPPQPAPAFEHWSLIEDRGPYQLAGERRLIAHYGIDLIVSKNSGGEAARPKLEAAREAGVPVIMVERPEVEAPDQVFYAPSNVRAWLESLSANAYQRATK